MIDENLTSNRPPFKKRSSSISAPVSSSLEAVVYPPSGSATPENGTPGYRRRKPATRSQSARMTGGRSVRKKSQTNLLESKIQCTSEPRLNDVEAIPAQKRRGSQRKQPQNTAQRKPVLLDVPHINIHHLQINDEEDDENIRLRTFSSSKQGVINRGDSFRRRHSNSLAPINQVLLSDNQEAAAAIESYRVAMLGSPGVGKDALLLQFKSSECINTYDSGRESPIERNISIILNGEESELKFIADNNGNKDEMERADAFLVIYSVVDKSSFTKAEQFLVSLQDMDLTRTRPVILVANKIDLARSRSVSCQDGKCLACTFRVKHIEVSVAINHNVDELLAGILSQIRLKQLHNATHDSQEEPSAHWYKNRNVVRASMKARQMVSWIFGKEDKKFKICENLQVL